MPWYGDNPLDSSTRQESYFVNFVLPFIDKNYPTVQSKEGRYLMGISKAGCGSVTLLLRFPELFHKAAAFDAPLMYDHVHQFNGSGLVEVFGTEENFQENYYLSKLLQENYEHFQDKEPRFVLMGYCWLKEQTQDAHELMLNLGMTHIYDNSEFRAHKWQSGWLPILVEYLIK